MSGDLLDKAKDMAVVMSYESESGSSESQLMMEGVGPFSVIGIVADAVLGLYRGASGMKLKSIKVGKFNDRWDVE